MTTKDIIQKNIYKIVIIHENFAMRQALKFMVEENFKLNALKAEVFTSSLAEDGLFYSMLVKPDLVILDNNIPKYEGRDVVDYLSSNEIFQQGGRGVIVFSRSLRTGLPKNYYCIDRSNGGHFEKYLMKFIGYIKPTVKSASGIRIFFSQKLVSWILKSNHSYQLIGKSSNYLSFVFSWGLWMSDYLVRSLYLLLFLIFASIRQDENRKQYESDLKNYRIKYYSLLSLTIVTLSFLCVEIFSYFSGGSFVLGAAVENIFQNQSRVYSIDLADPYNEDVEGDTLIFALSDVRGADTVFHTDIENYQYETEGMYCLPPVIRYAGVGFTRVGRINEVLSKEVGETDGVVLYQLSGNGFDWYYYEDSSLGGRWEMTTRGVESASDIDMVNKHIDRLDAVLENNKLYIKIIKCGVDSASVPVVDSLEVLTSGVERKLENPKDKEVVNFSRDDIKVELFDTLVIGDSISVRGKVLEITNLYKLNPPSKDVLDDYVVKLYVSHSKLKDEAYYLGNANLFVNSRGELQFNFKGTFLGGGYIVAELVQSTDEELNLISKPLDVGVVTVDSTLDFSDLRKDGICNAGDNMCTLRAALYEIGQTDNQQIRFNISKYDPGYRDADRPELTGSGNSVGGDDYWYISIESNLNIPEGILNDNSQRDSQGSTRSNGAEIVLDSKYLKDWIPPDGIEVTW